MSLFGRWMDGVSIDCREWTEVKVGMSKTLLEIRDFGNDRPCADVDEVFQTLAQHYRGQSISVMVIGAKSGMAMCFFFDVDQQGVASESYGELSGKAELRVGLLEAMELPASAQDVVNVN